MATNRKVRIRSPQQLKPGVELRGGYRIVRKVAVGGTAWVFEATHVASNRRVAIKVLNDQYRGEPNIVKRFANEARAAMSLDSPHVVRIEAVGRLSEGLPFLAMEYLDGSDLYHVLKDAGWRMPVERALYIVDQVARALEAAHAQGIIHRDIKPENIFLLETPEGELAKVVDFGLSRVPSAGSFSGLTKTGTTVGTPHYMALEQLRGDKTIDGRADVYALGVLTYELLSGHCPFEGDDPHDVMVRAARDEAPPLSQHCPELPAGLLAAIARAMERDRNNRCPTAGAFREAIRPYWSGAMPAFGTSSAEAVGDVQLDDAEPATTTTPLPAVLPAASQLPPAQELHENRAPASSPPPAAMRTPLPVPANQSLAVPSGHGPTATVAAILLAALVLALGLTCFIVDTVRGTPGTAAHASLRF
jgi:eukaryotic-like serine/threonine-protein kinase